MKSTRWRVRRQPQLSARAIGPHGRELCELCSCGFQFCFCGFCVSIRIFGSVNFRFGPEHSDLLINVGQNRQLVIAQESWIDQLPLLPVPAHSTLDWLRGNEPPNKLDLRLKKKTFPHGSRAANESEANFVSLAGGQAATQFSHDSFNAFNAHKSFVCWFKSIHLPYKHSAAGGNYRLSALDSTRLSLSGGPIKPGVESTRSIPLPFNAFQCVIINMHGHGYTTTWHLNDSMQSGHKHEQTIPQLKM